MTAAVLSFRPGDSVRVHLRIVEGESERVQVFEGTVLRRRGTGPNETFTVRKFSFGVGVERTFPMQSPRIQKIEVSKTGKARRARLYYLRKLSGKAARLEEAEPSSRPGGPAGPGGAPEPKSNSKEKPEPIPEKSATAA